MSRQNRRPTTSSRGSSSHDYPSLSVTEALQSIRLTETTGEPPNRRRRPSYREEPSPYVSSPYEPTAPSSTLDPSVLDSTGYPNYTEQPSYPTIPTFSRSAHLSGSASMSYPSFSQAPPISNPYRPQQSTSHYRYPSTENPVSRSMSGPLVPSMPARTYQEVRNVGREFAERYPRRHRPRRQQKILLRQAVLPSTSRASLAEDVSGTIDPFLGHSGSSFDSSSPYGNSTSQGPYGTTPISRSYDPSYTSSYGSGTHSPFSSAASSRGHPAPDYGYGPPRRSPHHADPVVIETPSKPQCWDHGCNGRQFSTFSNLLRHQREKSGASTKSVCHRCGAEFTRKTARDGHLAHDKCKQKSPDRR